MSEWVSESAQGGEALSTKRRPKRLRAKMGDPGETQHLCATIITSTILSPSNVLFHVNSIGVVIALMFVP